MPPPSAAAAMAAAAAAASASSAASGLRLRLLLLRHGAAAAGLGAPVAKAASAAVAARLAARTRGFASLASAAAATPSAAERGLNGVSVAPAAGAEEEEEVTIHFVDPDGHGLGGAHPHRFSARANVGESVVDVAKRHGVDIHAACGQQLQCATCHIIMQKALYEDLPEPGVRESDMLETAYTLTETSRLGCQVRLSPSMHGAEFTLPSRAAKGLVRVTPEQPRRQVTATWTNTPAVAPSVSRHGVKAPPPSILTAAMSNGTGAASAGPVGAAAAAAANGIGSGGPAVVAPHAATISPGGIGSLALEWERLFHEQRNRAAFLEQQLNELRGGAQASSGPGRAMSQSKAAQVSTSSGGAGDSSEDDDKGELEKLKTELESTIVRLDRSKASLFDDVVGLEDAKRVLRESVLWPALGPPELFRGIRGGCRGVLLYGPPGCGKTMLARAAAAELCGTESAEAATFFHVRPSDVMSKYYGDSQKRIAALEALAQERSPAVVFLDEVDTLLGKRDGGHGVAEHHKGVTNAILTWMDGFDRGAERVFFIGATNRAGAIDEAALRRFGDLVEVGLPDEAQRRDLLESLVRGADRDGHRSALAAEDLAALAGRTEGMSGDDVARLAQQAFLEVLRDLTGGVHRGLSLADVPPVTASHFDSALSGGRARASRDVYKALQGS